MEDEWPIDEVFDDDYLSFYLPFMPEELSDAQSTTIWSLLGLAEDQRVLDLACGHGRIANRLGDEFASVPVTGVLCFIGADWGWLMRSKQIKGVTALWPTKLPEHVAAMGDYGEVVPAAARLRAGLKPAT